MNEITNANKQITHKKGMKQKELLSTVRIYKIETALNHAKDIRITKMSVSYVFLRSHQQTIGFQTYNLISVNNLFLQYKRSREN